MTSTQYAILLLLSQGPQVSPALYELELGTNSNIRRVLRVMVHKDWIEPLTPVKVDGGQGRPLNQYGITATGAGALDEHEQFLETLR